MRQLYRYTIAILAITSITILDISAQTRPIKLGEVTVTARRKLKDIGISQTVLDSTMLRESITYSLADVLTQNTSMFIKSYGRGSLATASFRGTSPSHTQVTWNGMKLNSPMLGMVDFSLIPSYFIDDANVYHGSSSVGVTGGGLGGAISLATKPEENARPISISFIQGISSYDTYDEFLKFSVNKKDLQLTTRVAYTTADNDYKYKNINKEGSPIERNKNGSYKDFHAMQEIYYNAKDNNKFNLSTWFSRSDRGIPMLMVNYKEEDESKNQQLESTIRVVGGWEKTLNKLRISANTGFTHSDMKYMYLADNGVRMDTMVHTKSKTNTGFGELSANWFISNKWLINGKITTNINNVESRDIIREKIKDQIAGNVSDTIPTGYNNTRVETSSYLAAKYRPHPRLGLALDGRIETFGNKVTPLIPAAFVDFILIPQYNIVLKASASRNYRYPTLNDLYFLPGGNPSLKKEKGYTYDVGMEYKLEKKDYSFSGEFSAFDSNIKDWILWRPTGRGFWSPDNIKKVHSYGFEAKAKLLVQMSKDWKIHVDGSWAKTKSINHDDPMNEEDEAVGKQLIYIPIYSGTVVGRLSWKDYILSYKFCYYSERFTTSSNLPDKLYRVAPYYMNDISVEKGFTSKYADITLKINVQNLFDEAYESVLKRPMSSRNYGFFVGISPKW